MSYNYAEQRPFLFTEEGQVLFLKIRDRTFDLLKASGCVMSGQMISGCSGDAWHMLACCDRLVELKELVEIPNTWSSAGQYRIFISPRMLSP